MNVYRDPKIAEAMFQANLDRRPNYSQWQEESVREWLNPAYEAQPETMTGLIRMMLNSFGLRGEMDLQRYIAWVRGTEKLPDPQQISQFTAKSVDFLWYPRIPKNFATILEGTSGVGKSFILCAIAAGVSIGSSFINKQAEPADVIFCSKEDPLEEVLLPRLEQIGADTERIYVLDENVSFELPDVSILEHALEVRPNAELIIVDGIAHYLKGNMTSYTIMTRAMESLAIFAKQKKKTVLITRHMPKGRGDYTDPNDRGIGSVGIAALMRSTLQAYEDPDDNTKGILFHTKSNVGPKAHPMRYTVEHGEFYWLEEDAGISIDQIDDAKKQRRSPMKEKVIGFLKRTCGNEFMRSDKVKQMAKEEGLSSSYVEKLVYSLYKEQKVDYFDDPESNLKGRVYWKWIGD